ncbi:MAG TPA: four helix bundle protein [Terriglobales bacterium]|nr:four helix bundle protein [Terriglobales bacterium]
MGGTFRDLKCWQKAFELTVAVYAATRGFPKEELFGLTSQLRRAAISVMSNIAEGKGRLSDKDSLRFFGNARGSLFEVESQIDIAERLTYISQVDARAIRFQTSETGKLLNGLIRSFNSDSRNETAQAA